MMHFHLALPGLLLPVALAAQVTADTASLADLVVTATRVPVATARIPAATTVLRGEDLRAQGIVFVSDALRQVPGMMLVSNGSYGALTSVFLRGGESDYVKVLLDGVPLNEPGGSVNLTDLTTADLDRIEVVRGPASVLYGADAMSGVVQLFTRSAAGRRRAELGVSDGTFGTASVEGDVAGRAGVWSASAAGLRMRSDGIYPFNNQYGNTTGSLRLARDGADNSVALTARATQGTAHYPTDDYGAPVDHNQYTTDHVLALGLAGRSDLDGARTLSASAYASRTRSGWRNRPDGPSDTLGFGFDADGDRLTWRRGAELRFDQTVGASVFFLGAGIERESEDQSSRTVSDFGAGRDESRQSFAASRTTHDAYGQAMLALSSRFDAQLGARLDDNSAFGSFATWRAGLTWRPTGDARVWLTSGTAFKAPTFSELFARSVYEVGNPDLGPERSRSLEIGAERQWLEGRLQLHATLFQQTFRDLVQYTNAQPGETNYHNVGAVRSRGLELGLSVALLRDLRLEGHWAIVEAIVRDTGAVSSPAFVVGEQLVRRPRSSGGATVLYHWRGASATIEGEWVGDRADVDFRDFPATRTTLPSYLRVNAGVVVPVGRTGAAALDLTLRGENLFDATTIETFGFPGRGRTVLAGGRVRF